MSYYDRNKYTKRTTNRERRLPIVQEEIQSDGTVKVVRHPEPLVLMGFGQHDLAEFVGYPERVNEAFVKQWPPRYRRQSICTEEEVALFQEFTTWLTQEAAKR